VKPGVRNIFSFSRVKRVSSIRSYGPVKNADFGGERLKEALKRAINKDNAPVRLEISVRKICRS